MKTINLTQGKVALVDDEDYNYLMQWKWYALKHRGTFYARRNDRSTGVHKNVKMHRIIMGITDSKIIIDHEDTNGLNNQKSNLRICTESQNQANRGVRNYSSSKYKGITRDRNGKRWRSQIKQNGKVIGLGYFDTEVEAAIAYDNAAKKYHGEFANLNFKEQRSVAV